MLNKKIVGLFFGFLFGLLFSHIIVDMSMYNDLNKRLLELESKASPSKVTALVTTTMYNPVVSQCDEDPLITAANLKIDPNKASEQKYVALSRNLLKRWGGKFSYKDKVYIKGAGNKDGVYIVADTMHPRFVNHVDILETSGKKKYKYTGVLLTKVNP
ncbi:MAG TPA: hypothetical protein PLF27_10905 [Sedimentibacter sp.]|jgi:3D (Asp-Asp-Asp) domain-containing protein|nr:hypothetical protein [Sedimentibacter sp.]